MDSPADRLRAARRALEQRHARRAVKLLRGILEDEPEHIEALRLLSKLALSYRKYEYAAELLNRALKLQPRSAAMHMNLGVAYQGLQRYDEAIAQQKQALRITGRDGLVHFHLGNALAASGRLNDACHSYQRAIHLQPAFVPARLALASVLVRAEAYNAAVVAYRGAIELDGARDDVYVDLANALRKCRRDEPAMQCYQTALELNGKSISALNNLSNLLRDHGLFDQASDLMQRAVALAPNNPVLHNGLGLTLAKLQRVEEAQASFQKALELKPSYANAHFNLGRLYEELGQLELAEEHYGRALEADATRVDPHRRLGKLWLGRMDYARGWPEYAWRAAERAELARDDAHERPAWEGGPVSGKTVLVEADEPVSDVLHLARFARGLEQRGAHVLLLCRASVAELMKSAAGVGTAISLDHATLPAYDVRVELRSLPPVLGVDAGSPWGEPNLRADPEAVERWKSLLGGFAGLHIGIAWRGPRHAMLSGAPTISESVIKRLASVPGVRLVNLQPGLPEAFREELQRLGMLHDLAGESSLPWHDLAAIMTALHLVIAWDGPMAYMAGGLGAPAWVAVGRSPEWVWGAEGEHSGWYPSVRIFRTGAGEGEEEVFDRMEQALQQLAAAATATVAG